MEYPLHQLSEECMSEINKGKVKEIINYLKLIPNQNYQNFGYCYENIIKR